jgi:type I restriction enzyme S subunit
MVRKPLSEVAYVVRGIAFPKEDKSYVQRPGDVACLRTTNVQKQVEWDDLWFVPAKHVKRDDQNVRTGDILISTANSYELVGKVAQVAGVPTPATLGAFISLIRPKDGVHPKFLYHQLAWGKTQTRIREMSSNTTNISNVSTKKLATLDLAVPDLDEQTLIVSELEKQFSRLDEAAANLQRVKANLKRYKAAVLKDAVEGRLVPTEAELARREGRNFETGEELLHRVLEARRTQWQGKRSYREPVAPLAAHLPEVPLGWVWASPQQISAGVPYSLAIGPFGSSLKVSDYKAEGVPLVFVRNIRADSFGGTDTVYVTPDKAEELKAHLVESGDILVTKMGAPPGDVCMYPAARPPAVITADCIKLRLMHEQLCVSFFRYAIESKPVQSQILGITKGVAQLKVSLANFNSIAFPLPPAEEQYRIVAEVERRLSLVREVEYQINLDARRSGALRQSILTQAFTRETLESAP